MICPAWHTASLGLQCQCPPSRLGFSAPSPTGPFPEPPPAHTCHGVGGDVGRGAREQEGASPGAVHFRSCVRALTAAAPLCALAVRRGERWLGGPRLGRLRSAVSGTSQCDTPNICNLVLHWRKQHALSGHGHEHTSKGATLLRQPSRGTWACTRAQYAKICLGTRSPATAQHAQRA